MTMNSVHDVMKAEKIILKSGYSINIIATPREISHNCGVVVKFRCDEIAGITGLIRNAGFVDVKLFRKGSMGFSEFADNGL